MNDYYSHHIKVINADITTLKVDAIVNAANSTLLGGGGVDGAIHKAAGPELFIYCKNLGGCQTGEAKITPGFNLPAKFIIHTVGPRWGEGEEEKFLSACYKNSLELAIKNNCKSIAFPAISTGVYRYPLNLAAEVAVKTIKQFIEDNNPSIEVILTCRDERNCENLENAVSNNFN